jgi:hypothetical protein
VKKDTSVEPLRGEGGDGGDIKDGVAAGGMEYGVAILTGLDLSRPWQIACSIIFKLSSILTNVGAMSVTTILLRGRYG